MNYGHTFKNIIVKFGLVFILLLTLSSCGGGSSNSGGVESLNLNGSFNLTSTTNSSDFFGISGTVEITQQGNQISGTLTPDPLPFGLVNCLGGSFGFTGTVSGNSVIISGEARGGSYSTELTGTSDRLTGVHQLAFNGVFCRGSTTGDLTITRI